MTVTTAPADPLAGTPPALRVDGWDAVEGLAHGFFGRAGGVSSGPLAALNVSERVGDSPGNVGANWALAARALPGLRVVRMTQVHGARVVRVDAPTQEVGEADAMFTATPGVGLAVLTADCVPLLGVAPAHGAVLAVHAGWRGTLAGVAAAAVEAASVALAIAPASWRLALGPSIGGCCYEVEADLGARFVDRWGPMPDAWRPMGGRGQLDLRAANRAILTASGVPGEQIENVGPCTSCAHAQYFSHRASGGFAGRQLSLIGLPGPA